MFTDPTGDSAVDSRYVSCDKSKYIIRDFLELEEYRNKPYVAGFPHMRSYLEVPLTTSKGRVVGGYCVVDNVVRPDFDNEDSIYTMTELASSVMDYLELVTVRHNHDRGERLMEGLSLFAEGHSSFITASPSSLKKPTLPRSNTEMTDDLLPSEPAPGLPTESSGQSGSGDAAAPTISQPSSSRSQAETSSQSHDSSAEQVPTKTPREGSLIFNDAYGSAMASRSASISESKETALASKYNATFSRAANLIREAMDMDGLVFLDGVSVTGDRSTTLRTSTDVDDMDDDLYSSADEGDSDPNDPGKLLCQTLGSSIGPAEDLFRPKLPLAVNQRSLRHLIKHYPRGCTFSVDSHGILIADTIENEQSSTLASERVIKTSSLPHPLPSELQGLLSTTRSVIFLPLWDVRREQFFAGLLGWTMDPTRVFEVEDYTCLSAFGDSLMTELARLEAVDLSTGKSNFISSVSHELRSPLHGLLAGADLLSEVVIDDAQAEMVRIIQTCGTTLLDTLNHLLDFSKINHLDDTKIARKGSSSEKTERGIAIDETSKQDLGELVQDVVEGVYLGYISKNATYQGLPRPNDAGDPPLSPTSTMRNSHRHPKALEDSHVAVFLQIEENTDWSMPLRVGAWKRIVMNLFANALKYTQCGQIEISLSKSSHKHASGSSRQFAEFSIRDTGIGMSSEYIKHQLFKPFAQENPLADGTGLGLSIVKQIVNALGGVIDVQSEVGFGTNMDVMIPLVASDLVDQIETPPATPPAAKSTDSLRGKTVCVVSNIDFPDAHNDGDFSTVDNKRTMAMTSSITRLASKEFGMNAVLARRLDEVDADFYVAEAPYIASELAVGSSSLKCHKRIISVGSEFLNDTEKMMSSGKLITHLRYPIGRRNLGKALLTAIKTSEKDAVIVSAAKPTTVAQDAQDVSVDAIQIDKTPLIPTQQAVQPQQPDRLGKHLLLVDDNAINLKVD